MKRTMLIASLATLAACGVPQDKFAAKYADAVCSWADECGNLEAYGFDSADTCATEMEAFVTDYWLTDACEYDKKAAKACIKEVKGSECEASGDEDGTSECDNVCAAASDTGA